MKKIGLLIITVVLFFSACKKENNVPAIQSQTFEVKSTSSTTWKYFSFTTNDTVNVTNPENSTAWDIAFQRYRVKTNSGLSGNGMGGAANSYMKGQSGFDALSSVPDTSTFVVDETISVAVVMGYQDYIVNPLLYTWFSLEFSAQGTQILPTDYIYIVKTSTGKYAKVWFKSYYSATNQSGYVTFQYKYQPDGSKNLE
jgi:hypothetical protein